MLLINCSKWDQWRMLNSGDMSPSSDGKRGGKRKTERERERDRETDREKRSEKLREIEHENKLECNLPPPSP